MFSSRTPTAGFRFGEKNRTTPLPVLPRSKTPAPQTRTFRPSYGNNTTMPRVSLLSALNFVYFLNSKTLFIGKYQFGQKSKISKKNTVKIV